MAEWLTPERAIELLGNVGEQLTPETFASSVDAAAVYVAENRPDLYGLDVAEELVFQPTPTVELGTALLALRWKARLRNPLRGGNDDGLEDVLSEDPDIGRMLGVGKRGRPIFGAPSLPVEETVV